MLLSNPNENEVEVTLIGTGGGYGETLLLKIGKDDWVIIDSCINPNNKIPLSLEYLKKIGVDYSSVKLVICTHWHNDHILGLGEVLKVCENAEFAFSAVSDLKKFLRLCGLDEKKYHKGSISSTTEFSKCIDIVTSKGAYCKKAMHDMLLLRVDFKGLNFELYSLTPSPKTVADFETELSELISEFGSRNTAVIKKSPNEKSVALLLKFGEHRVLLGADLESGKSDDEGWRFIANKSNVVDSVKSKLFKVPHHGSKSSYLPKIYEEIVEKNSILKIAPFANSKLPKIEMLEIFESHSENIFLTSNQNVSKKPKKRDKSIEKIIDRSILNISEVKFIPGIIQSRLDLSVPNPIWKTELFENAFKYKS